MVGRRAQIDVEDTPFDPRAAAKVVEYREVNRTTLYRVYLRLVGADGPFVRCVEYHLHPTFDPPVLTVTRTTANPDLTTDIWTWGVFEVRAIVTTLDGEKREVFHRLTYDQYFDKKRWDELKLRSQRV